MRKVHVFMIFTDISACECVKYRADLFIKKYDNIYCYRRRNCLSKHYCLWRELSLAVGRVAFRQYSWNLMNFEDPLSSNLAKPLERLQFLSMNLLEMMRSAILSIARNDPKGGSKFSAHEMLIWCWFDNSQSCLGCEYGTTELALEADSFGLKAFCHKSP